jgi:hypothetical protein
MSSGQLFSITYRDISNPEGEPLLEGAGGVFWVTKSSANCRLASPFWPSSFVLRVLRPRHWNGLAARSRGEDQSHHAFKEEVIPRPVDQHKNTIAEANQIDRDPSVGI